MSSTWYTFDDLIGHQTKAQLFEQAWTRSTIDPTYKRRFLAAIDEISGCKGLSGPAPEPDDPTAKFFS